MLGGDFAIDALRGLLAGREHGGLQVDELGGQFAKNHRPRIGGHEIGIDRLVARCGGAIALIQGIGHEHGVAEHHQPEQSSQELGVAERRRGGHGIQFPVRAASSVAMRARAKSAF